MGDVQIEDKIYTFDSNGIYTGKSKNAVVYAMNIKEPFYADKLPDSIVIYTYYLYKDMGTFEYDYDTSDFTGLTILQSLTISNASMAENG